MNEADLIKQLEQTKEKLNRALRRTEGLKHKSAMLDMQYKDAKDREQHTNELVMELIERQRELNVMLNRANIMLNRAQETMALTSVEFNEMAKALPAPKQAEWSERVAKINDLFKKTGIQDGDILGTESSEPPSLESDEMKRESQEAFSRKESIWGRKEKHQPAPVEAELLPEDQAVTEPVQPQSDEPEITVIENETDQESEPEDIREQRRKSWWNRMASSN